MDSRDITPEIAKAELAKRELARRDQLRSQQQPQQAQQQSPTYWMPKNIEQAAASPYTQFSLGAGDKLANLMRSGMNVISETLPGNKAQQLPYAQSGQGLPYEVGKFAGDVGAFMGGGEILGAARAGAESIPFIGRAAEALGGGGLKGAGRRAVGSAGFGALESPEDRTSGALMFGALSPVAEAVPYGIKKIGDLMPSKMFRGNLTPEELKRNIETTKGTETGLGDVVQSPFLKRQYENVLSRIPGSGVEKSMQNTSLKVKEKGNELLNKLLGENESENVGESVRNALKDAQKEAFELKRSNYNKVNSLSDELGVKIGRENFSKTAKQELDVLKESPELLREVSSGLVEDLKYYANPKNVNNLKLSNIFKGKLGDKASDLYQSGNNHEYNIYKNLKDSLQRDIDQSIYAQGNKELKNEYDNAQKFYKENIAPFEESEITKFTREGGDPDLIISHFVKKGANDRSNLINKLVGKLTESQKGLVPYGYLSRAVEEGELNPLKFKTLYKSLGSKQRESLIPNKELKNELDNYVKLIEMNTEPLTQMFNPKTGQRNLDIMPYLLGHLGGAFGSIGGYQEGGLPGALLGAVTGVAAPAIIGKQITKKLTSPEYREKLINKMIKNESTKGMSANDKARAIAESLLSSLKNGKNGNKGT